MSHFYVKILQMEVTLNLTDCLAYGYTFDKMATMVSQILIPLIQILIGQEITGHNAKRDCLPERNWDYNLKILWYSAIFPQFYLKRKCECICFYGKPSYFRIANENKICARSEPLVGFLKAITFTEIVIQKRNEFKLLTLKALIRFSDLKNN